MAEDHPLAELTAKALPSDGLDPLADEQLRRNDKLKGDRDSRFMNDWQYISQYALPQMSNVTVEKTEGVSGWTDDLFDTTMMEAAQILGSGIYNLTTPQNEPWSQYEVPDELADQVGDDDDVRRWYARASDLAMRKLSASNFHQIKAEGDLGLSVFGTNLIIFESDPLGRLTFHTAPIRTYTLLENDEGIVDTVYREFKLSGRQALALFGDGDRTREHSLPARMLWELQEGKNLDRKYTFLHAVFNSVDSRRLWEERDRSHMVGKIASVYIQVEHRQCCRISAYDESPILCRRFAKWGTNAAYGFGPSYVALPTARQLNYVQRYLDATAEVHVNPRILSPDNLDLMNFDLDPGGITYWDSMQPNAKPEEWMSGSDYKLGLALQEQKRQAIRGYYFNDLFKLLNSPPLLDKSMTAYEVDQRLAEQLGLFTPVVNRQQKEFIEPLMLRLFGIMYRTGELGRAPAKLMRRVGPNRMALAAPKVVATSRMADALRSVKNQGIARAITRAAQLAQAGHPEVFDNFLLDQTTREASLNDGMPADLLRPLRGRNSVETMRQTRLKQVRQQRLLAAAEQLGKAGKGLGGSPQWLQQMVEEGVEDLEKQPTVAGAAGQSGGESLVS